MKLLIQIILLALTLVQATRATETNPPTILTLAEAQAIALKNHPQIAAANYRALAAAEAVKESRAGLLPNVSAVADAVGASAEGTRILAGGLNNPSVYDRSAFGLQGNQLITDFGRTANLLASSQFQAQAENQNASVTREQVLLQVDVNYFNTLEAQAVLQVAQKTLSVRQLLLDQVSMLASNKLKSELDVSFARVAMEESRLLVLKATNQMSAAMTSFSAALGLREPREFALTEPDPFADAVATNDVSALVEAALGRRPELLSLRDERESALRFAKSEREARLPVLEAIGVIGAAPIHDGHLQKNYSAGGIQLNLPLFAGGLYTARQHAAELKAAADAELLRAAENNIVRDVHLAWLNFINARAERRVNEQLARNAAETYELAEARYRAGSSSIVELSQAQLSLTSAQIGLANARYDVFIQLADLNYQTGVGP